MREQKRHFASFVGQNTCPRFLNRGYLHSSVGPHYRYTPAPHILLGVLSSPLPKKKKKKKKTKPFVGLRTKFFNLFFSSFATCTLTGVCAFVSVPLPPSLLSLSRLWQKKQKCCSKEVVPSTRSQGTTAIPFLATHPAPTPAHPSPSPSLTLHPPPPPPPANPYPPPSTPFPQRNRALSYRNTTNDF